MASPYRSTCNPSPPPEDTDHHKPLNLASPGLLRSSSCSVSSEKPVKEVVWKELSDLGMKDEFLEELNREKQQWEDEKAKMQVERYNMTTEIESLKDRVKDLQKREWKANERNRKLIADSYHAMKEERKKLADKQSLALVQCRNLNEKLKVSERELNEVKLRDENKIMELNNMIKALKGDIATRERESAIIVKEKEVWLEKIKDLEQEASRKIKSFEVLLETKDTDYATLVKEKEALQVENENMKLELNSTIKVLKADMAIKDTNYAVLLREKEALQMENQKLVAGIEAGSDSGRGCRKKTPEIESAASMSHFQQKGYVESDVVVLSDGDDNGDDGYDDEEDDVKPLSEALKLKRPLSDVLSGGGKSQSLEGDDRSAPRHKPDDLWKNLSQTIPSLPASLFTNDGQPTVTATPESRLMKLNGLSPSFTNVKLEPQFSGYDLGISDPAVMNILVSCQKSREEKLWTFDTDLACALESDRELCLKAICALYRQHKLTGTRRCGFKQEYAQRGIDLAQHLINGDAEEKMTRSMIEFEMYHRDGFEQCKFIAMQHKKELFEIYKSSLDRFFP